jgi:ABC-2 type transport system ATP-binding protein
MISVEHLSKSYGSVPALRDVTFSVRSGEVLGFLGPNGAGKSTTLRIITGFLGASGGRVLVGGLDVAAFPSEVRRRIGYMPEGAPLYPDLRVQEYLMHRATLKGVARLARTAALHRALQLAQITDVAQWLIGRLSKGYRQRVALADALIANPPLLVLDEPTAGLDPNQMRDVRTLLRELAREHTIVLSTHLLSEVEACCDRAVVLHQGRLVAEGTIENLMGRSDKPGLECSVLGTQEQLSEALKSLPSEVHHHLDCVGELTWRLTMTWPPDVTSISSAVLLRSLVLIGVEVASAVPLRTDLEQVFSQLTEPSHSVGEPRRGM